MHCYLKAVRQCVIRCQLLIERPIRHQLTFNTSMISFWFAELIPVEHLLSRTI